MAESTSGVAPARRVVTKADYARHRGIDPGLVTRWSKLNRLVLVKDEGGRMLVDLEASDALLAATMDAARGGRAGYDRTPIADRIYRRGEVPGADAQRRAGHMPSAGRDATRELGGTPEADAPETPVTPVPRPAVDPASYEGMRTRREDFSARKLELEYRERAGELVEATEYRRGIKDNIGPAIAKLESLPARVASRLAVMTDVRAIQDLLDDEIASVRTEIANYADALVQPGTGKAPQ